MKLIVTVRDALHGRCSVGNWWEDAFARTGSKHFFESTANLVYK